MGWVLFHVTLLISSSRSFFNIFSSPSSSSFRRIQRICGEVQCLCTRSLCWPCVYLLTILYIMYMLPKFRWISRMRSLISRMCITQVFVCVCLSVLLSSLVCVVGYFYVRWCSILVLWAFFFLFNWMFQHDCLDTYCFWVSHMHAFSIFIFAPVQPNWACFTWKSAL